jgi:hypothetical protein
MTLTPWALAYVSICVPTPESSGSTSSTVAPLVMSVCASVSWVVSLPRAFWTTYCDELSPAACSAFVMSGWSNST